MFHNTAAHRPQKSRPLSKALPKKPAKTPFNDATNELPQSEEKSRSLDPVGKPAPEVQMLTQTEIKLERGTVYMWSSKETCITEKDYFLVAKQICTLMPHYDALFRINFDGDKDALKQVEEYGIFTRLDFVIYLLLCSPDPRANEYAHTISHNVKGLFSISEETDEDVAADRAGPIFRFSC